MPYCQSELLFNALQKASVSSQYVLVSNAQHGPGLFIEKYFKMMTDFFIREFEITKVDTEDRNTPAKFSFSQNYPNPFNPSTLIRFYLPSPENLTVKVFNIAGQELETLINGFQAAGDHEIMWQPKGLPSGLYFCRLQAGEFFETIKFILQK